MIVHAANPAPSRIKAWFAARGAWQRRAVALAAGALATLGHAPFNAVPAFAVAIVLLIWLLDATAQRPDKLRAAFGVGWLFGLGHYLTGLYWIASPFMVDPDAWGLAWAVPALLAFAGGLALFWGAGCALAIALWTPDWRRIAGFTLAILASEWARGHLFGGFPWILPGYVWPAGEPVSQLAAPIGIYGLTAFTLLLCAAPAALADRQVGVGARFAPLIVAGLALGAAWGWGAQRIAGVPVVRPGESPIIVVADAGMSQAEKWADHPDQESRVLAAYLAASGPADDAQPTILVWPEGAIPVVNFFPLENPRFLEALGKGLGDRVLIMGVTRRDWRNGQVVLYNSAVVMDGVGGALRIGQTYDKYRLVPFGEFIPLWSLISNANVAPLQRIGAGFTPGPPPTRLIVPDAPPVVVLICYEAIFPDLAPSGEERPGWLVSMTNDSWFGAGIGPEQHYAMARYRAIEAGAPLARSASGGVSAIVDAVGRSVAETRGGGAVSAQLPPTLSLTPSKHLRILLTLAFAAGIAALRFAPVGAATTAGTHR
jgi:apolipoprotein N-acyltransferase